MWPDWLYPPADQLAITFVKAVGIYIAIILYTRLAGLRSFAKMSSFDFAMTVAIGSAVASTVLTADMALAQGAVGIAALYILQKTVAQLRVYSRIEMLVDNQPLLLVYRGEILEDNLSDCDITKMDLRAKLREANVLTFDQAEAVIFEATGDISVLHSDEPEAALDGWILKDVRGAEQFFDDPPAPPKN